MSIPVTPIRVDALLLPRLRAKFPDVAFGTLKRADDPPLECVLQDSMQGMCTPISQWVRLRVGVHAPRADGTGDWDRAARLWADIAHEILSLGTTRPLAGASLESGPVRMTTEGGGETFAYGVLLLQAVVV